jgi:hypothetical protein
MSYFILVIHIIVCIIYEDVWLSTIIGQLNRRLLIYINLYLIFFFILSSFLSPYRFKSFYRRVTVWPIKFQRSWYCLCSQIDQVFIIDIEYEYVVLTNIKT